MTGAGSTRRTQLSLSWGRVFSVLRRTYSEGSWRVPLLRPAKGDPFHVLVSTIVSHQTRDEVTARVSKELFAAYPTPHQLAKASPNRLNRILRPAGLAGTKGNRLIELSNRLERDYAGEVPSNPAELRTLPYVGPKTASAVLQFGFGRPAITVDQHVARVVHRLTGVPFRSRVDCELWLRKHLPRRYWREVNPVLVQHGQNLCGARAPSCPLCPIRRGCAWASERTDATSVRSSDRAGSGRGRPGDPLGTSRNL